MIRYNRHAPTFCKAYARVKQGGGRIAGSRIAPVIGLTIPLLLVGSTRGAWRVIAHAQNTPAPAVLPAGVRRVAVVFSGGYETDGRDRGRPVVLIAAALGVTPDVFREAFSRVRPAPAGHEPEPEQVSRNKTALLGALARYGVTNDRLDTVSNYYRYPPGQGSRWRIRPAAVNALVKNGAVVGYEIVTGGAGYSSPPVGTVPGVPGVTVRATLAFGPVFARNGSIARLTTGPAPVEAPASADSTVAPFHRPQ